MSKTPSMDEKYWWSDKIPTIEPNEEDVPSHLGGHYNFTNMDTASLDYLIKHYNIKSMLDVGCGTGGMVDYARSVGLDALGVDGDPHMASEHIVTHDYTKGPYLPEKEYDLIWSVEFVEHVEEKFMLNFLATFSYSKVVLLSHAQPWQGGKHHFNLKYDDYWIDKMEESNFIIDYEATGYLRVNSELYPYIHDNSLVFKKI
jgi:SAM-dependent methyltransferase